MEDFAVNKLDGEKVHGGDCFMSFSVFIPASFLLFSLIYRTEFVAASMQREIYLDKEIPLNEF